MFNVGIAYWTHDSNSEDDGYRTALASLFSIDEGNRNLTSNGLTTSLPFEA